MTTSPVSTPPEVRRRTLQGLLDWRTIVEWLRSDGVIDAEVADRTIERCSRAGA